MVFFLNRDLDRTGFSSISLQLWGSFVSGRHQQGFKLSLTAPSSFEGDSFKMIYPAHRFKTKRNSKGRQGMRLFSSGERRSAGQEENGEKRNGRAAQAGENRREKIGERKLIQIFLSGSAHRPAGLPGRDSQGWGREKKNQIPLSHCTENKLDKRQGRGK